jgi:hypothetical protein
MVTFRYDGLSRRSAGRQIRERPRKSNDNAPESQRAHPAAPAALTSPPETVK